MSPEQKQLIREKWRVTSAIANVFRNTKEDPDPIADWWLNELDLAIKQTEERIVEVIKESRNVGEQFGIGIKEQQTRDQIILDILTLIRNK